MAFLRRKPSLADIARANGRVSMGPMTEEGNARCALASLKHGLCAQGVAPVAALGETAEHVKARHEAVRLELGVIGPCAARLAASAASAILRGERAERLEAAMLGRL